MRHAPQSLIVLFTLSACRTPAPEKCSTDLPFAVADCTYDTLDQAVLAAWVNGGIVDVTPGTYTGSVTIGHPDHFDVNEVQIQAHGSTFDAQGEGAVIQIDQVAIRIEDATITGGTGYTADDGYAYGGAVFGDPLSTLSLAGCTITGNEASYGGGIFATTLNMEYTTVDGNTASEDGGGVYIYSPDGSAAPANIVDSSITNNTAFHGGGLFVSHQSAVLDASTISDNTADPTQGNGGGVAIYNGSLSGGTVSTNEAFQGGGVALWGTSTVTSSTLDSNVATRGGGVYATTDTVTDGGTATLDSLEITNNSADNGGGVSFSQVNLVAESTHIATNSAVNDGGGVEVINGTLDLGELSVVEKNSAERGGGIAEDISDCGDPKVDVAPTAVIEGNTATKGGGAHLVHGTLFSHAGASWGSGTNDNVGGDITWGSDSAAWNDGAPEFACSTTTGGCFAQTKTDADMDGVDSATDCDSTDICVTTCD